MNKKIYILCPSHTKTGGTELLHQLFYQLKTLNYNAFLAYKNYSGNGSASFTEFDKYVVDDAISEKEIEDDKDNLLILPEIYYKDVLNFSNIKTAIWWLSVDFFLQENSFLDRCRIKGISSAVKNFLLGNLKNKTSYVKGADYHLCQSYYAVEFLYKIGISEKTVFYLSDYINDLYVNNRKNYIKKDAVLYNPKKGYKFTKKLIKASPHILWIPLENLKNEEVRELLCTSKVYVDFGNHPGKDRIPREAAISGCCVITGKRGAAKNEKDLPIPQKYKFDEKKCSINEIVECIYECINNYDQTSKDFVDYRKFILEEKEKFLKDLSYVFSVI